MRGGRGGANGSSRGRGGGGGGSRGRGGARGRGRGDGAKPARRVPHDNDDMYDEVDRFAARSNEPKDHAASLTLIDDEDRAVTGAGDDGFGDVQPVLDIGDAASSDDSEYDDSDDSSGDDINGTHQRTSRNANDDEDDDEREQAVQREDALLTAWGKKRSAYHGGDAEVEVDDEAAAAEEQEALRMQRRRAAALDEEDIAFGASGVLAAPRSRDSAGAVASTKSATRLPSAAAEHVEKSLDGLSRRAKLDLVEADTPELLSLLKELQRSVREVRRQLAPVMDAVAEGRVLSVEGNDGDETSGSTSDTRGGLAYLEVKHALLLSYISLITFYLLLKAEGRSVRDHPVLDRLVHTRATLERMRPLDAKLQATVTRLLKAASTAAAPAGAAAGAAQTSLRPNVGALLVHGDGSAAAAVATGDSKSRSARSGQRKGDAARVAAAGDSDLEGGDGIGDRQPHEGEAFYRPLRRAAVAYDGDPAAARAERDAARRAARVSKSALLADLRSAYGDAPEEADALGRGGAGGPESSADVALERAAAARAAEEEDAFTRFAVPREEKKLRKARERERSRWSSLAELEQFGDVDALLGREEEGAGASGLLAGGNKRSLAALTAEAAARTAGAVAASATAQRGRQNANYNNGDGDDDDDDAPSGRSAKRGAASRRRSSGGSDDDDEDDDRGRRGGRGAAAPEEADPFYAAVEAAALAKRARREHAQAAREEERAAHLQSLVGADDNDGARADGHRKASRLILANRGLVKYRKRDDKNPRVAYRLKAAKAEKRRSGAVPKMRAEAGGYGGEATGIRSGISRSRKIK